MLFLYLVVAYTVFALWRIDVLLRNSESSMEMRTVSLFNSKELWKLPRQGDPKTFHRPKEFAWNPADTVAEKKKKQQNIQATANISFSNFRPYHFEGLDDDVVVFYNIYIPPEEEQQKRALELQNHIQTFNLTSDVAERLLNNTPSSIFENQLQQMLLYQHRRQVANRMKSNAATRLPKLKVYYNTIGQDGMLFNTFCQGYELECVHMHHYKSGTEALTLQNLYDYCSSHAPGQRVVYLHAKGSFHNTEYNDRNRALVTYSVLNKCVEALIPQENPNNTTCDACGGLFLPVWGPFFSANMWAAQCDYIRRLVPPIQFSQLMNKLPPLIQDLGFQFNVLETVGPYCLGTDRYSSEHWVASHPDMKPCDARGVRMQQPAAPRLPITSKKWRMLDQHRIAQILQWPPQQRLREYFLLPGYLFRTTLLYHKLPPLDSWAFSWFPDGDFWREQTIKYGMNVLNTVWDEHDKLKM